MANAELKTSIPTRPVVRYHGGKWKLAPWIISHFPPHKIYVEPFGGAASVLMQKPRSYSEIYNDLESEVVNVFRVLRDRNLARELERLLRLTPFGREDFIDSYTALRGNDVERARRFILRGYQGFGSASSNPRHSTGFRAVSNGSGTTPAHDWASFPNAIAAITDRLAGVYIEKRPALKLIRDHDSSETLFYVDPPYPLITRGRCNREVYKHDLSDQQHRNLARALNEADGIVVLSGYRSSLYEEIYPGWIQVEKECNADGARYRTEVLWLNPKAEKRMPQLKLFRDLR